LAKPARRKYIRQAAAQVANIH